MVFSSIPFLFLFLPAVLLLCAAVPRRWRNCALLPANLLFYAYGEPVYVLLMLASIAVNYGLGLAIGHPGGQSRKKPLLVLGVALNLLGLLVFKYAGLLTGTLAALFPGAGLPVLSPDLPIGISFYTFQAMSYVIDVYRGACRAERSLVGFAAYISLFPQLIAGPIVRYSDIREQLRGDAPCRLTVHGGVRLFVIGLAKKVLLANPLGLLWAETAADPAAAGTLCAWMGLAAYSLQLYFDFSGYSDMARGLGALLGFDFCVNFDYPYLSRSVTEFWRRWHISLSGWFRDYVYIPLGGSRRGTGRACLNLLITWALTGLWHGAGWNFLAWGVYYGALLMAEKYLFPRLPLRLPGALRRVLTLLAVMLGWLLFASDSFGAALRYLGVLFSLTGGTVTGGALSWVPLGLMACVAATPLGARLWARLEKRRRSAVPETALALAALILCTACLVSESYNPFLYFRF